MEKFYIVNYDKKSEQYYVSNRQTPGIPVFGSFCQSKREASEFAKMYSGQKYSAKILKNKLDNII